MNINHSPEYIALWKSHKRAEWEAARVEDEQESRRKRELCSEIGAELERVVTALTPDQRKNAEKVLKQWEQEQKQASLNRRIVNAQPESASCST